MIRTALHHIRHAARRWLFIGLVSVVTMTGMMAIAVAPSYAQIPFNSQEAHGQTPAELTDRPADALLTPEERLDRAYSISEAAGLREETRQAEGKSDPTDGTESLLEKAKDAVEQVLGD